MPVSPARKRVSQSGVVGLAGTNADDALDIGDEDFAVANLTRLGRLHDGFDDLVDQVAAYCDLDAGLGYEIDHVLGAAIQLGVASLPAEALHFGDGHARNADVG